ncbi:MAG: hypothetical protein J1F35_03795 [Erysipelotrichales bacterium]|nr:hypothetical protein [Erysipelotrichales bacterium]
MRDIQIYKGKEIDKDKLIKMKNIAVQGFTNPKWKRSYKLIYGMEKIISPITCNKESECLVLGNDWYLLFEVEKTVVNIVGWVAIDEPETKLSQSIEMLTVLKELFLKYKDRRFVSALRHTTSFQLYTKMLNQNYFNETNHRVYTYFSPIGTEIRLKYLSEHSADSKNLFDKYLNSGAKEKHPEDLEYVLHKTEFRVTDKFIEKYDTEEKKYIL